MIDPQPNVMRHLCATLFATLVIGACSGQDNSANSAGTGGFNGTGGQASVGGASVAETRTSTAAGAVSTGGQSSNAGSTSTGGSNAAGGLSAGGSSASTLTQSTGAGSSGLGGKTATGGADSNAGKSTAGGATASGGKSATGGASATGGTHSTGGIPASGGKSAAGGAITSGGTHATGGTLATAGASATGGTQPQGGTQATGTSGTGCPYTGHVTYTLSKSSSPTTEEQNAYTLITAAMDKALSYYNCYTNITKADQVSYVPSVSTADGNINGSIRFGSDTTYMDYRTAMHEIAHTVGIGTASTWTSCVDVPNTLYTCANGKQQLATINSQLATPVYTSLHADSQHFWPYGINYQSEVTSEAVLVYHCEMVMAIRKDLGLNQLSAVGCRLSAVGCRLSAFGCRRTVGDNRLRRSLIAEP